MQIRAWGQTDEGLKRDKNEDAFLIKEEMGLYIVADGMGGHLGGEVASRLAVETFEQVFRDEEQRSKVKRPADTLLKAYQSASAKIYAKSLENDKALQGMGTTVVAAYLKPPYLHIGNVGDSRCYLFSSPLLWQVTEDHSLLYEQLRAGLIREDQVTAMTPKNMITRSVGFEERVVADLYERRVSAGELYLLCSDGLTDMVEDTEILQLMMNSEAFELPDKLIEAAKKGGGNDNISAVVLEVVG